MWWKNHKRLVKLVAEQQKQIESLEKQVLCLQAENAELKSENAELKKLLEKNPPPSPSTPSGMKPPYEKPNRKNQRKKPGRKKGHPGVHRAVPSRIDETVEHTLKVCPDCGTPLAEPVETRTRCTEDLPPVQTTVTEHIINRYWCTGCRRTVEPAVDAALPNMQMGIRLLVMTAFMHYFMGVPINGIRTWMSAFASFNISAGGLSAAWRRLAQWLSPLYEQLGSEARTSEVLHVDETGWRVVGRTWWLWCFTGAHLAYYLIARCRGSPVVARVLGKMFAGTLVCDFFGAYNLICAAAKQRCLVHLFRELHKVLERNTSAEWTAFCKRLKRLLHDAMRLCERRETMPTAQFEKRKTLLHTRLDELCAATYKDPNCRRLVKRLSRCREELFTFVDHQSVPPDNNHAERQLRPAVIMRKNSYCNRSEHGAETQATLMSIFRTLHMRNANAVETLCASLRSCIASGNLLPLPFPS